MISYQLLPWLLAILALLPLTCGPCLAEEPSLRTFLNAARYCESGNDNRAVGDGGVSRGPLQCGRAAWQDGCEYAGVSWDYDRLVWNPTRSRWVLLWYAMRYGARTCEERARCWNSGPKWRKKFHLTNAYWRRIERRMKGANHDSQRT